MGKCLMVTTDVCRYIYIADHGHCSCQLLHTKQARSHQVISLAINIGPWDSILLVFICVFWWYIVSNWMFVGKFSMENPHIYRLVTADYNQCLYCTPSKIAWAFDLYQNYFLFAATPVVKALTSYNRWLL